LTDPELVSWYYQPNGLLDLKYSQEKQRVLFHETLMTEYYMIQDNLKHEEGHIAS